MPGKDKKDSKHHHKSGSETAPGQTGKLGRKEYEHELRRLHIELVKLQQWVVHEGLKVCVVFEGRDGAGKGGTIKAITERVSSRVFRVVALPAPTDREKSQMYLQRYVPHFPAAGEIVIFDRSWYNRAGVERVMGFCTEEQAESFLRAVPLVERAMVDSGIILIKYWLEVSPEEQHFDGVDFIQRSYVQPFMPFKEPPCHHHQHQTNSHAQYKPPEAIANALNNQPQAGTQHQPSGSGIRHA